MDNSDRWNPLFNCSKFALKVWNEVAEDSEKIDSKLIVSPGYLVDEIVKFELYEKSKECVTDNKIRYYKEGI